MIRLEPDWVGELVSRWASKDWVDTRDELGYPQVSPMFSRVVGTSIECEDVTDYSSAELRAVAAAIDWLQLVHPEHWRALSREFRTWTRTTLVAKDGDQALVIEAGKLIADYVDNILG